MAFNVSSEKKESCSQDCKKCGKRSRPNCEICHGKPTEFLVEYSPLDARSSGIVTAMCVCNTCQTDAWAIKIKDRRIKNIDRIFINAYSKYHGIYCVDSIYGDEKVREQEFSDYISRINGDATPAKKELQRKDWDNFERNEIPF